MQAFIATINDYDRIVALFLECDFSLQKTEWFKWKHFENPFGDSIVLKVENNENKIIATISLLQQKYYFRNKTYIALQAVDGVIHREARGKRLFSIITGAVLNHHPINVDDSYFYTGFSSLTNSKKALISSGWISLMDMASTTYILNSSKFITLPGGKILSKLCAVPWSIVRSIMFHGGVSHQFQVKQITSLPSSFEYQYYTPDKITGDRSAAFFNWRVFQNPRDNLEFFRVEGPDGIEIGYIVGRTRNTDYEVLEWKFIRKQREGMSAFLQYAFTSKDAASVTFLEMNNVADTKHNPPLGIKNNKFGGSTFVYGLEKAGLPVDPKFWNLTMLDSDW